MKKLVISLFLAALFGVLFGVLHTSALAASFITYDSATKTATLSRVNLTQPSTMITDDLSNAYVSYYETQYLYCTCYEKFGIRTGGKFTAQYGTGIYNNNYSYKHQPYLASSTGNFYNGVFFTGIASKPDTYIGFDPAAKPITNLQNPYPASYCFVCNANSTDWDNIREIPYDVAYDYGSIFSKYAYITDVLVPRDTTVYYATGTQTVSTAVLKNCSTTGRAIALKPVVSSTKSVDPIGFVPSLTGDLATEVVIDGGTYSGSPAVSGSNITVKRGTFTDNIGTSQFLIDPDSEASVSTSGGKTITTVKLSNPPIIIDWDDFPGLDIDLSAPTIEVIRNPADSSTPTDRVTLTIRAQDPNGEDSPTPISINGGAFQANNATYVATENQIVSIVARDANGNVREYQATISNIDSRAPEVIGFKQSTESWTKDPVRVYVEATDDVKLHLTPYQFEFQPNSGGSKITSAWQADRSFQVTENGTLWVTVRDSLGKTTKSDPYYIRNIDTVAPTATYTLSPPEGMMASPTTGVTVDLILVNTGDPVTQDGSALAASAVKWSSVEGWSSDLSRTFYENGVYNIQVRDAVGNVSPAIPITINNISSDRPIIDSFTGTHLSADYVQAPVTLTVSAHGGGSTALADKPYSWDGGKTWTSLSSYKVYQNGEYSVMVRDAVGTVSEASLVVSNIDAVKPTASVYLFKGLPADGSGTGPDDYVWKIRVEAEDIGSDIDHIETLWDGGTHTSSPIIQDVEEAGVYGVIVYDKAGNQTYAEKVVTNEAIGNATGTNNGAYVEVSVPETGTAGSYFNASIGDLVYGPTGAYNKVTNEFKTYQTGVEGIQVNLDVTAKSGTTVSGYATFNSVRYSVTFEGATEASGGRDMAAQVFIPISSLTTDVRNSRLVVVVQEKRGDELQREGSATLYTSVQIGDPKISYTYNRGTDELTMVCTSAVAGIKSQTYNVGSGEQSYSTPFTVGGADTVVLRAVDNVNNVTEITLDGDSIALSGEGGGTLPTEGITGEGVTSYYIAGRSAETYIIGGNRSNTDSVPSSSVFDAILGGP